MPIFRTARGRFTSPSVSARVFTRRRGRSYELHGAAAAAVRGRAIAAAEQTPDAAATPSGFPRKYKSPFRRFLKPMSRARKGDQMIALVKRRTDRQSGDLRPQRTVITAFHIGYYDPKRPPTENDIRKVFNKKGMAKRSHILEIHGVYVLRAETVRKRIWKKYRGKR